MKHPIFLTVKWVSNINNILSKGGEPKVAIDGSYEDKYIRNFSITGFIILLNSFSSIPIKYKSGLIDYRIDLELPDNFLSLSTPQLKCFLEKKGFEFEMAENK